MIEGPFCWTFTDLALRITTNDDGLGGLVIFLVDFHYVVIREPPRVFRRLYCVSPFSVIEAL